MDENILSVDTGNWSEFPGTEEDKVKIVLDKLTSMKPNEGLELEYVDPVSIPEIVFRIREVYGEKRAIVVSNFGGCACGECDNDVYYVIAIAETQADVDEIISARAKGAGMITKEEAMEKMLGGHGHPGEDIARAIVQQIADKLGEVTGQKVEIRQMSLNEMDGLNAEGLNIEGFTIGKEKKRTVH